jgi:hypothetical protein
MYKLKAFCQIAALIDNTVDKIAPIGELSDRAHTYGRSKELLNSAAAPGYTLVAFSSKREGVDEQVNGVLGQALLGVCKWAYEACLAGKFNSSSESFRVAFLQQYSTKYSVWTIGAMVQVTVGRWMPSVIEIRDIANDQLQYKLWFSSDVFEQQYDEYHIEVVGPVEDLDAFFLGRQAVIQALAAETHELKMEKVQAIREKYPESFISGPMFEWFDPVDPTDKTRRIATYWTPMVYGIAGNNIDAIKEALRAYILANSTHTKDQWAAIFPEIFTSTEFIFVPMWNKYSIPNRELESGLYSSVANFNYGKAELIRLVRGEGYTDEYISGNSEIFGASHKAIAVAVTGSPHNRDGVISFVQRYYDYINVDATSLDFMRMNPETRRMVLALAEMLAVAESMTPDSALPVKFSRLIRDGVLYVAYTLDRFQLIVTSRYSAIDGTLEGNTFGEPSLD